MTKKFISSILRPIRTQLFRYQWRRRNKHNNTYAINCFHAENVSVGKKTYGPIEVLYDNGFGSLSVGNYCSIAREVKFFLGGEHDYRRISTYPFQTLTYQVINGGG